MARQAQRGTGTQADGRKGGQALDREACTPARACRSVSRVLSLACVLCCCSLSLSLLAAGTVSNKLKEQLSARLAAFDLAAAVAGAEPGGDGDGGGDDDDDDDDAEPLMAPSTGWPPPPPPPPPTGGAAAIMV